MKFEMLDGCNRNKLFTAIANQNLFYLWRVAGGDSFDCILTNLRIHAIQLAYTTIITIPSAQNDGQRGETPQESNGAKSTKSLRRLWRRLCSAASEKGFPFSRHPERKKSC